MPTETINLYLVGLQTFATFIAAIAAVAMWRATVNLVKVTRGMVLANVAPEVVIGLEQPQPFATKETAIVKIENRGSVDLFDVEFTVGGLFHQDDGNGQTGVSQTIRIGNLNSSKSYTFPLWDIAKSAIRRQKGLDDKYSKARADDHAPVEVHVTSRHGATGIPQNFDHTFLVDFDSEGNLCVAELFVKDGKRTVKRKTGNTTTEETTEVVPIEKLASDKTS
jgi:hypothetical protein